MKKIIFLIVASMLSINAYCQCTDVLVSIETQAGSFADEMSWELVNSVGETLLDFQGNDEYEYLQSEICLPEDCYALIGYDSYGDGWNGGYLTISYNDSIINFDLDSDANSGVLEISLNQDIETCNYSFYGCTYEYAYNYDAEALVDNGTCMYPGVSAGECSEGQIIHAKTTSNDWSEEVSWKLTNELNEIIYEYESPGNYMITVDSICVNTGCYLITLEDSYGDGWVGDYLEIDLNNDTEYDISGTVYTYTSFLTFEIDTDPCDIELVGCTDPNAVNYVPGANQDNGTCISPFVYTHNGIDRTYWLDIPDDLSDNSPLLFFLHGYTGSAYYEYSNNLFGNLHQEHGFVACYPQGTNDIYGISHWNASLEISEVDDLDFIVKLAMHLQSEYNLDPNRIFSCGYSNGGYMSYTLACKASNTFRAIASVAGTMSGADWDNCNPDNPRSVMQVCGVNDTTVPMDGITAPAEGWGGAPNIYEVVEYWADLNNTQNTYTEPLAESPFNTQVTYYTDGTDGNQVRLYVVSGMGHNWPSNQYQGWNCSREIWEFFSTVSNPVALEEIGQTTKRTLIRRVDLLGREVKSNTKHGVFIDMYDDGTAEKNVLIEKVD
jgi:polyhydroxybutyrate depolymerase